MAKQRTWTGHSGQNAVKAELLFRQCNVAVPEVDLGTDVFAFRDARPEMARIQVKTAQGRRYKNEAGYSATFHVPLKQLEIPDLPPLYYACAVRLVNGWGDFLILRRYQLNAYRNARIPFGTEDDQDLVFTVQFRPDRVVCGEVDLTVHRNAWDQLPPFRALPDTTSP
jgi:hypothetical protein